MSDRVALADSLRHAGRLTDADLDECDRQLGIPGSRVAKPAPTRFATEHRWLMALVPGQKAVSTRRMRDRVPA